MHSQAPYGLTQPLNRAPDLNGNLPLGTLQLWEPAYEWPLRKTWSGSTPQPNKGKECQGSRCSITNSFQGKEWRRKVNWIFRAHSPRLPQVGPCLRPHLP
jgi:hypothetical protein